MQVKILHLGDAKFQAFSRDHQIICDQPASNGGSDSGMTPPEFLLVSLGTCAGYYAAQYLKNHSLQCEGLEVTVSAEKVRPPVRLGNFHIDVFAPGLSAEHEAGVLRAVHACLIHNTLGQAATIETALHTAPVVAA